MRQQDFSAWEKEIVSLERQPFQTGGIVFAGSSTIRLWTTLEKDFAPLPVYNRGFGGSQLFEATHFFPRIVAPLRPRQIVLFCGTNDINAKKPPRQVASDFMDFALSVRWQTRARLSYIEMTSSPSRWSQREQVVEANEIIKRLCARNNMDFIPVREKLFGENQEPRPELFIADRLHLNPDGYKILTDAVKPFLR